MTEPRVPEIPAAESVVAPAEVAPAAPRVPEFSQEILNSKLVKWAGHLGWGLSFCADLLGPTNLWTVKAGMIAAALGLRLTTEGKIPGITPEFTIKHPKAAAALNTFARNVMWGGLSGLVVHTAAETVSPGIIDKALLKLGNLLGKVFKPAYDLGVGAIGEVNAVKELAVGKVVIAPTGESLNFGGGIGWNAAIGQEVAKVIPGAAQPIETALTGLKTGLDTGIPTAQAALGQVAAQPVGNAAIAAAELGGAVAGIGIGAKMAGWMKNKIGGK